MKIAFTTKGTDWASEMDARFGRTHFFVVYNDEKDELTTIDNQAADKEAHGAGTATAQKIYELAPDVLITGNGPGGNAKNVLSRANIKIFVGAGDMTVKEAYEAYKNNNLKEF